ncbi:hypothetical protein [Polynucleobacter sp. TUM22923]|nr:hypothetical protein [Polynucleobacter sp. TUM22923]
MIDGKWVGGASCVPVNNPATGEALAHVANLGSLEAEAAIAAADRALPA